MVQAALAPDLPSIKESIFPSVSDMLGAPWRPSHGIKQIADAVLAPAFPSIKDSILPSTHEMFGAVLGRRLLGAGTESFLRQLQVQVPAWTFPH